MNTSAKHTTLTLDEIRADFPNLQRKVNGKPLVYFDNGASTQKPKQVIERYNSFYSNEYANIHRGVHTLSQEATSAYEATRGLIQQQLNAKKEHEIIFTKGTTDGINLVAFSFGEAFINEGDELLISELEHHSNIVPWQLLCERKKAHLKVVPIHDNGEINLSEFQNLLSAKTKLVAIAHVSNTLGTINPVEFIIEEAHKVGAKVLLDGAQAVPHQAVDVQALNCDFYVYSAHKLFGPTGFGVLYGKEDLLNAMPPYQGGGDMIDKVTFARTTYNTLPHKFEAGTPNISAGIAFAEAIRYINTIGYDFIGEHEYDLLNYATEQIQEIQGVKIYGTAKAKAGVLSFLVDGVHPYDLGTLLDQMGIAVRTGHHCTQPLMDKFGIPGTVRASFAFYNTRQEIDYFMQSLKRAVNILS